MKTMSIREKEQRGYVTYDVEILSNGHLRHYCPSPSSIRRIQRLLNASSAILEINLEDEGIEIIYWPAT